MDGKHMEIERKFLVRELPESLEEAPSALIEQAYLCTDPVVRVRREENRFYMTYKSRGLLARQEYNLPLSQSAYLHLLKKADGLVLRKRRFCIPLESGNLTAQVDLFEGAYQGLVLAEVEFPSVEAANRFLPPCWFGEDVTQSGQYQNSLLSQGKGAVAPILEEEPG